MWMARRPKYEIGHRTVLTSAFYSRRGPEGRPEGFCARFAGCGHVETDRDKLVALVESGVRDWILSSICLSSSTFITMVATLSFSACSERAGWVEFSSGLRDSPSPA